MQIKAEEISQIIKGQIKEYESKVDLSETGTVISVGDGIARVYGVENCMAMELLEFPGGILGLALNLEEDNVGCAVLGDVEHIKEGDIVKRTGRIAEVPVCLVFVNTNTCCQFFEPIKYANNSLFRDLSTG